MSKKNADTVQGGVLAENQAKINNADKAIKAALERKRKIIVESKLYTYDMLSELYGGAQGQALLDAVTAEHEVIRKFIASGMTLDEISGLADDNKVGHQMSFSEHSSYTE